MGVESDVFDIAVYLNASGVFIWQTRFFKGDTTNDLRGESTEHSTPSSGDAIGSADVIKFRAYTKSEKFVTENHSLSHYFCCIFIS